MEGSRVKRWALRASLPLALLLIPAPGASAATCTAAASGAWTSPATWTCGAPGVPGTGDAVVIPAGKTVSVAAGDTENAAYLTLGGTLALGDEAELDAGGLAASGGTISGPQYAMLVVTTATGAQATVDGSGLTVDGAYLNVTGDGSFAIAGPLSLNDGGWVESGVDAIWTGSAPWRIGGAAGTPASGFEVFGAQLTIAGATAAQPAGASGAGVIQLNGGSTLTKQDATTSDLGIDVLIEGAAIRVVAGKLIGDFQGAGSLSVDPGATLVLGGSGLQVAPPAIDMDGGALEVEPDADVTLQLPNPPALRRLAVGAGATLGLSIDDGATGPVSEPETLVVALGDEIAVASGATLGIAGGGGTLALGEHGTLSGSGTLDASLANDAGAVSPAGSLRVTGNYVQLAAAALVLDLRAAGSDALVVAGSASLAGTLEVRTSYAPAATAAPLVLGARAKPSGTFAKTRAPLPGGRAWEPAYTASGVTLGLASGGGGVAPTALTRPSLQPAVPVVGGRTRCLPGKWQGAQALKYEWLRGGKPIARAKTARYRVAPADRGRPLACRVTASASGGAHAVVTSKPARARTGLGIGAVTVRAGGGLAAALRCTASERGCRGSLRVLVAGRVVASGRFALRSPGAVVQLAHVVAGGAPAGRAVVRASYRNAKGASREVRFRIVLPG